jgi:hypothetical protein
VSLTTKQKQALKICAGIAMHCMLFGGSRSGKTFLFIRNVVIRALKAPNTRHVVFRFRSNHIKASIWLDTFPKVMRLLFPDVDYTPHVQEMYVELPNGSQIWFGGLDDKERTEKILGMEFITIYFNEVSQIPYESIMLALTRLAQLAEQEVEGVEVRPLKLRAYYDCNPPTTNHWTYKVFIEKIDPETRNKLTDPENYISYKINPIDNTANLSPEYIKHLENMPARMRKRFLDGDYADANPNALFPSTVIDRWRVIDGVTPDFVRVVVAVDPSGSGDIDNADNDAIGIVVVGLGVDGNAYVLEDCTVKAGPATWGNVATSAYERHQADCVVAETNYGGAMVQQTINVARARTPFKAVTASRGKAVRAEPFSALYEQGKIRHVGMFVDMEDELAGFSTNGYIGAKSPNSADALIWALAELFPGLVNKKKETNVKNFLPRSKGW